MQSIREGVDACCAQDVFLGTVARMRKACEVQVDFALNMMPLLSGLPTVAADAGLLSRILDLFFREGDRSQFGLANAITAVARDTRDPDLRWDLEELGGGIAVGAVPQDPANEGRTAMARLGQAVAAG
ncbi:MAG: hypothetical protein HYU66_25405 [Armatimonadetes bacterium]|nr:hypothetical protein [Armatimonadota bacterium]